jgi:hypothetical protein
MEFMNYSLYFSSLQGSEAELFLQFLFQNIGHKPKRLTVTETVPVVAYLMKLATTGLRRSDGQNATLDMSAENDRETEEKKARKVALGLAQTVWGYLLQFGDMNPRRQKATVKTFFERHRKTYFANLDFETIGWLIESFDIPASEQEASPRPAFLSRQRQLQLYVRPKSRGKRSRLENDLSERIYVAHWILEGIEKRDALIAQQLNKVGIERPRKMDDDIGSADADWDEAAVTERAKMFDRIS